MRGAKASLAPVGALKFLGTQPEVLDFGLKSAEGAQRYICRSAPSRTSNGCLALPQLSQ